VKSAPVPEASLSPLGVVAPPPIDIQCEAFSGSLAALFQVVRQRKVDLLQVPLQPICEAYFQYLLANPEGDLDSAAAALVALSYLIQEKSHALIPVPETYLDDPDLDFNVDPYVHEFAPAIQALEMFEEERDQVFFRGSSQGDLYELPFTLGQVTSADLSLAFERLLRKAQPDTPEILQKPRRSLADQMQVVRDTLTDDFRSLLDIVPDPFTRTEAVWWFLAMLELIRLGQARVVLGDDDVLFARGVTECV